MFSSWMQPPERLLVLLETLLQPAHTGNTKWIQWVLREKEKVHGFGRE